MCRQPEIMTGCIIHDMQEASEHFRLVFPSHSLDHVGKNQIQVLVLIHSRSLQGTTNTVKLFPRMAVEVTIHSTVHGPRCCIFYIVGDDIIPDWNPLPVSVSSVLQ